ncbi:MAG: hypothetical protein K8S87_10785 [Planctomycetes bacterium]|nr:hypothetical protein [Planctomycetota bacterium]
MFKELQHILESEHSYDFESQVILNRNVIISAYIKVKNLRENHGFDIDFEDAFWKASAILKNFGIQLVRFNQEKPIEKQGKSNNSYKSKIA